MVAVKGRLNSITEKVTQDKKISNKGEAKKFKIYAEGEKAKNRDTVNNAAKGKSILRDSGSYFTNVGNSKSGIKNFEKGKSKVYNSGESDVGRKVLADISNVRGSFLKSQQGKYTRPGKGKSEILLRPQRNRKSEMMCRESHLDAAGLGNMEGTSSKNSLRGSSRPGLIQATEGNQTLKKSIRKTVTSHEPSTKFQGRSISTTNVGKCVKKPPYLTRKSMPVLKQTRQIETSGSAKKNSEKLSRRKPGFPVKPRQSSAPKTSNLNHRPWGNRISDGFVLLQSRSQTKLKSGALSRKSIKPAEKSTNTALTTQVNSRSTHMTIKKFRPEPVDIHKRKQDSSSVSKDIPVDQVEAAPKEDTSGSALPKRKSGRRSSFISSLMSTSKSLKECGKVTPQEALPSIYNELNPLEVSDYVDDIYQYYWVMEGQNSLLKDYMSIQKDVTPNMRGILINWLIEVHQKFDLMEETLFLTVTLIDRYLSLEVIKKNEFQMVGLTSLLLASKYEDFWHPRVSDLISISAELYTKDQMLEMEKMILKKLKFRLNEPTPYVFMLRFIKAAQSDMKFEQLAFYLIELCLIEYEVLNFKPSMLCASAIYVARCTLLISPPWTPLLTEHTRYKESQIRACAELILKFHKAAKTGLLKVTYEKFITSDRSKVAAISPLDRLPLV
ncbi:putative cyclin-B3-1 [Andrographis paniculata]|uniref:putative cyclin-B3-1 n=1 Tax=Andrographis paniculata TaxID=175694 RepID=UPI0021E72B4B|nr:putative cyclin-B3-1 [Andrographis paniculata]XP_051128644.1 putative cyclin-B3-1 [Andrographis paniculata]